MPGTLVSLREPRRPPVVQLPLLESPINGYMMYSYHLAVTLTAVDAWPWFFSNFVQLQCNPDQLALSDRLDGSQMPKGEVHFTEGSSFFNPWLANAACMDHDSLQRHLPGISSYIVEHLAQGSYVETYLNEFYIPALFNGGRHHFGHRLLVYGYDDTRRSFNIIGFDRKSQYRQLECSYAALDAAFFSIYPQYPDRTRLFRPDPSQPAPAFDDERFLTLLEDYLSSRNSFLNPDLRGDLKAKSNLWFGLKVYDFLGEYIRQLLALKKAGTRPGLDFRGFHTLWEHKRCMASRLEWMSQSGYPLSEALLHRFSMVVSQTEALRTRVLMCRNGLVPPDKGYLEEVPVLLDRVRSLENDVLRDVLAALSGSLSVRAMATSS